MVRVGPAGDDPAAAGSRSRCRLGGRRHLDRPAAAPQGEQGPRPALDRDTLPKALAALVNRAAPGRLVLIPLHGTPGQRPAAAIEGEPGQRWT